MSRIGELQVGDVFQWLDGPWGTAVVKGVSEKEIEVFRPYGKAEDFASLGWGQANVICYIGVEISKIPRDSPTRITIWRRAMLTANGGVR